MADLRSAVFFLASTLLLIGSTHAIIGGTADDVDPYKHPRVVVFQLKTKADGLSAGACTATLMDMDILLTGAHCVGATDETPSYIFPSADYQVQLYLGPSVAAAKAEGRVLMLNINSIRVPEGLPQDPDFIAYDVAIIKLALDATQQATLRDYLAGTVAPALPLAYDLHTKWSAPEANNMDFTLVGFGGTGARAFGKLEFSFARRYSRSTLRQITVGFTGSATAGRGQYYVFSATGGGADGGACPGDSGGPALVTLNGTVTVVGVTAFGTAAGACGSLSYYARLDTPAVLDWLRIQLPPKSVPKQGQLPRLLENPL